MGRHRVAIVVLNGTFVLDLAVAVQAFGRRPSIFAKIREEAEPPYEVVICGDASTPTSLGFSIGELESYDVVAGADTVLVPGTEYALDPLPDDLHAALVTAHQAGARMVSLCAGAFVLGQAGRARRPPGDHPLGDGQRVPGRVPSGAPGRARAVRRRRPGARPPAACWPRRTSACTCWPATTVSRTPTTSPGCWSARRTGSAARPSTPRHPGRCRPARWPRCWPGWRRTSASRSGVEDVAARAHMSQRTLVRRFRAETGESLAEWVARRRIERARALLEDTDLPVAQVAHDAGFGSVEALRRHFRARVGTSPRAYRDTFRARAGRRCCRLAGEVQSAAGDHPARHRPDGGPREVAGREDRHLVAAARDRDHLALGHVAQGLA